jgi:DNA-binding response OmpR family regulator
MTPSPAAARLLILDPPPHRLGRLAEALGRKGHSVSRCEAPERALPLLAEAAGPAAPDLVLIRHPGPARAGLDLLGRLRQGSRLPMVLIGGPFDAIAERVAALELGADDHLPQGMPVAEMLARIQALLRRAAWGTARPQAVAGVPAPPRPAARPIVGGWRLIAHRRSLVSIEGAESLDLTGAEFELLRLLSQAGGEPVDREAISRAVFRRPWRVEDRAVDGLVKRVRRKLRADAIATVRGIGYALRFADQQSLSETATLHAQVEICVQDATRAIPIGQPEVVSPGGTRSAGCINGEF